MKLRDKVAIITGSQRGIGRGIAEEFAKEGCKIVISDIDLKGSMKTAQEIAEAHGVESLGVKCDVSNKNDVEKMILATMKKFGKLDILVNNAGVVVQKSLLEMTEKDWDFVIDVNLKGCFLCSQAAAKEMVKKKKGKIISIASIAGEVGFLNTSAYCASKGGIITMTKEMALELASHGVNVNAIGPGVIETKMTEGMLADPETKKGLLAQTPLGRVGQPEEIGRAAVYLASSDSDFVTGQTLFVDGGWLSQ